MAQKCARQLCTTTRNEREMPVGKDAQSGWRRGYLLGLSLAMVSCLAPRAGHAQAVAAGYVPSSFLVDDTGAATYTIPIQISPGIAGMEPELALTYNSRAGNGLLGAGWAVAGLSFISRCGRTIAQDSVNAGVSYDSNDRYCLDGQRLVMISAPGVTGSPPPTMYGLDGVEYRTEAESYTRIISYGNAGSGPLYFRAWTKAGLILEYGNTDDSRIEAQGKTSVRVYAVNRISDTSGNYLTVSYTEDNPNGDYYPAQIAYTGNATAGAPPNRYLTFSYEARTDITPSYVGGSVIKAQNRLTKISGLSLEYLLAYTYSPNNGPSLLTSVTARSTLSSRPVAPLAMTWQFGSGDGSVAAPVSWAAPIAPMTPPLLGDIDGDGLADLVYVSSTYGTPSIVAHFSNGSGFDSPPANLGPADYATQTDPDTGQTTVIVSPIALADVDGDGRADVITAGGAGAGNVRKSMGRTTLATATNWGAPVSPYAPAAFGDIDGDGLSDMVYTSMATGTPSVFVRFSKVDHFDDPVNLGFADSDWDPDTSSYSTITPIAVGDVNGDGRADVVTVSAPTVTASGSTGQGNVRLSQGNVLAPPVFWGSPVFNSTVPTLADVNGDGFADLVYVTLGGTPSPSVIAHLSNGAGFAQGAILGSADTWLDPDGNQQASAIAVGDLTGDGSADLITVDANSGGAGGNVRTSRPRTPDLITKFTDSLTAFVEVAYSNLTDSTVYSKGTGAQDPIREAQPRMPLQVVSYINQSDGIGGKFKTSYTYAAARTHRTSGRFLGFATVAATTTPEPQQTLTTTKTFRQDYPFQGLPTQVVTTLGSSTILKKVTTTWDPNPAVNPLQYNLSTGKYHRVDLTGSEQVSYDLDGTALPTIVTTTSYDAFGNALDISVSTKVGDVADGYSKATHNAYLNPVDATRWLLGRLVRSQVTSTVPLSSLPSNLQIPSRTRASAFEYDASTGLLVREVIEPGDPASCLATTYVYDSYGHKTDVTARNCNSVPFTDGYLPAAEAAAPQCPADPACIDPRTSHTSFDASAAYAAGQFPTSSTNALGHQELREFDPRTGTMWKLTGPNGLVTTWAIDDFGRRVLETRNAGTSSQTTTTWAYERCADLTSNPYCPPVPPGQVFPLAQYRVRTTTPGAPETSTYYDSLNRAIRTETQGFDGNPVRKDTQYDALGRVAQVSQSFVAEGSQVWTIYAYDILGRVVRVDEPVTSSGQVRTGTAYSGLTTTTTVSNAGSGAGMPGGVTQTETRIKNSQGQVVQITRQ